MLGIDQPHFLYEQRGQRDSSPDMLNSDVWILLALFCPPQPVIRGVITYSSGLELLFFLMREGNSFVGSRR